MAAKLGKHLTLHPIHPAIPIVVAVLLLSLDSMWISGTNFVYILYIFAK